MEKKKKFWVSKFSFSDALRTPNKNTDWPCSHPRPVVITSLTHQWHHRIPLCDQFGFHPKPSGVHTKEKLFRKFNSFLFLKISHIFLLFVLSLNSIMQFVIRRQKQFVFLTLVSWLKALTHLTLITADSTLPCCSLSLLHKSAPLSIWLDVLQRDITPRSVRSCSSTSDWIHQTDCNVMVVTVSYHRQKDPVLL